MQISVEPATLLTQPIRNGPRCTVCTHPERDKIDLLLVSQSATLREISAQFNVHRDAIHRHQHRHLVQQLKNSAAALVQHTNKLNQKKLVKTAIAVKEKRISVLDDMWSRLQTVVRERGADTTMAEVPGGKTGLLARTLKQIGSGESAQVVEEYEVDTGLLKEMRAHAEQAARELGEWDDGENRGSGHGTRVAVVVVPVSHVSQSVSPVVSPSVSLEPAIDVEFAAVDVRPAK